MRPRKRVLIFCDDEIRGSVLRYRLELMHPIRAVAAHTMEALVQALMAREGWDCLVWVASLNAANQEAGLLMDAEANGAKLLEVRPKREREIFGDQCSSADRVIWTDDLGEICPVVYGVTRRKCGPTKSGSRLDRIARPDATEAA